MGKIKIYTHRIAYLLPTGKTSKHLAHYIDASTTDPNDALMSWKGQHGIISERFMLEEIKRPAKWAKFNIDDTVHYVTSMDSDGNQVIYKNMKIKEIRWVGEWEYVLSRGSHLYGWVNEKSILPITAPIKNSTITF